MMEKKKGKSNKGRKSSSRGSEGNSRTLAADDSRRAEAQKVADSLGMQVNMLSGCNHCAKGLADTILRYRDAGKIFHALYGIGESIFRNCENELSGTAVHQGVLYGVDESTGYVEILSSSHTSRDGGKRRD